MSILRHTQSYSQQLSQSHDIVHEFKDSLFRAYLPSVATHTMTNFTEVDTRAFNNICDTITSQVRTSLKQYFASRGFDVAEDVAIAVKLIVPPSDVITILSVPGAVTQQDRQQVESKSKWIVTARRDHTPLAVLIT